MPFTLVITRDAMLDMDAAFDYYEEASPGLGERFLDALKKRFADLAGHPHNYSYIDEDPEKIFRDVKLEKFPFVILFEITGTTVIVYALHNTYRDPSKKTRPR